MKSWTRWLVAVLLSIGAGHAFADGSCQPGFGLRAYPFYDKAGAYIGTRQACAPIPCTPGYQDSTCAAPLRNGAIPQPQCQSGAGWTMVTAAVWQGSRWSQPQCNYAAPPSCPSGFDTVAASSWTGASWTQPTCTPHITPPPPISDPNQVCTAAANNYTLTAADMQSLNSAGTSITRSAPFRQSTSWQDWSTIAGANQSWPYQFGPRGDRVFTGTWTGPWYNNQLACHEQNSWAILCFTNPANGAVDSLKVYVAGASNGQCNH